MEKLRIFLFISFIITFGKLNAQNNDTISGDFNGDGLQDTVYLLLIDSGPEPPYNLIDFSIDSLYDYKTDNYFGGILVSEGDLNGDGIDEFSIIWFGDASEWMVMELFTISKDQCKPMIPSFSIYGIGDKEKRISKSLTKDQTIIILEDKYQVENIVMESIEYYVGN